MPVDFKIKKDKMAFDKMGTEKDTDFVVNRVKSYKNMKKSKKDMY